MTHSHTIPEAATGHSSRHTMEVQHTAQPILFVRSNQTAGSPGYKPAVAFGAVEFVALAAVLVLPVWLMVLA